MNTIRRLGRSTIVIWLVSLGFLISACGNKGPISQEKELGGIHVGNPEGNGMEASAHRSFESTYGYQVTVPHSLRFSKEDIYSPRADFNSLDGTEYLSIEVIDPFEGLKNERDFEDYLESEEGKGLVETKETPQVREAHRSHHSKVSYEEDRLLLTPHRQLLLIKIKAEDKTKFNEIRSSLDKIKYDLEPPVLKNLSIDLNEDKNALDFSAQVGNEPLHESIDIQITLIKVELDGSQLLNQILSGSLDRSEKGKGLFELNLELPEDLEPGTYRLGQMEFKDYSQNRYVLGAQGASEYYFQNKISIAKTKSGTRFEPTRIKVVDFAMEAEPLPDSNAESTPEPIPESTPGP